MHVSGDPLCVNDEFGRDGTGRAFLPCWWPGRLGPRLAIPMQRGNCCGMETVLSLAIGIGLSAACGFRVFVPLLILSIASTSGQVHLSHGFAWIGTPAALVAFGVATLFEVAGYYLPVIDHFLDTLATPAAAIAGTLVTAAFLVEMSPWLKWSLAAIAGGGTATIIQSATVGTRLVSTATTAGIGNPLLAVIELAGSIITSILALVAPWIALALVLMLVILSVRILLRCIRGKSSARVVSG